LKFSETALGARGCDRYVPCEWGHGVLNIQETIGAAVEFVYTYVCPHH
jgi:hypothetical protein